MYNVYSTAWKVQTLKCCTLANRTSINFIFTKVVCSHSNLQVVVNGSSRPERITCSTHGVLHMEHQSFRYVTFYLFIHLFCLFVCLWFIVNQSSICLFRLCFEYSRKNLHRYLVVTSHPTTSTLSPVPAIRKPPFMKSFTEQCYLLLPPSFAQYIIVLYICSCALSLSHSLSYIRIILSFSFLSFFFLYSCSLSHCSTNPGIPLCNIATFGCNQNTKQITKICNKSHYLLSTKLSLFHPRLMLSFFLLIPLCSN